MIDILRGLAIYGGGTFCVTALVEWLARHHSMRPVVCTCWSLGVVAAWLAIFVIVITW